MCAAAIGELKLYHQQEISYKVHLITKTSVFSPFLTEGCLYMMLCDVTAHSGSFQTLWGSLLRSRRVLQLFFVKRHRTLCKKY